MKKIFALLLTIFMCLSATDVALADEAKATVSDAVVKDTSSEVVYLTVELSGCEKADTMGISVEYDSAVLKLNEKSCEWLKDSGLKDFDASKNKGVWGVEQATDINGKIFKLAFTLKEGALFDKSEVKCTITLKNGEKTIGTYTATGSVTLKCDHTFGAWTSKDATNHARVCTKCKAEELAAHTWNEGVVTKEATATEAGKKVYTCSVCSATREEEIPATGTPEQPGGTDTPSDSQQPGDTDKPSDSQQPSDSETPSDSQKPSKPQRPSGSGEADDDDSDDADVPETSGVKLDTMVVNNKVQEIKEAEAGTELVIEMKNTDGTVATVVPVEILEAVSGKDVDVVLDMGDYSWTINGQNVTASELADINLEVLLDTQAVAADVVNEVANGDDTLQITLQHNGDFGFEASLTINVGKDHAGEYGNLYYYDNGKLVFMNAALVDENGDVSLAFTHASDYVIVLGEERTDDQIVTEPEDPTDTEVPDVDNSGTKEPAASGGNGFVIVIVILVVIAAAGVAVFVKKKYK